MKPELIGQRVLVLPDTAKETTDSGLLIPEKARERPQTGRVLLVGPGTPEDPMIIQVGESVLFPIRTGVSVEYEGQECIIFRQSDLFWHIPLGDSAETTWFKDEDFPGTENALKE